MAKIVLGLDIGGANLKAATSTGRALSASFAVWKQPEKLGAAIKQLVAKFPEAHAVAATMTAELCDCYETKSEGVKAIVDALAAAAKGVRIWSTDGEFVSSDQATNHHMKVAAANWHALATFVERFATDEAVLIDIGSTTTDIVDFDNHFAPTWKTDQDRLQNGTLVYTGVRRTPVCAVLHDRIAAELFATMEDVYIVLEMLAERPNATDTADGRPCTWHYCRDRLCRMMGGDRESITDDEVRKLAQRAYTFQRQMIAAKVCHFSDHSNSRWGCKKNAIVSGAGEFLARDVAEVMSQDLNIVSMSQLLTPALSLVAPAYAVAVLAAERP